MVFTYKPMIVTNPIHFYEEEIEAHFDEQPKLEKKPGCPQRFSWRGSEYEIAEVIGEWHDYSRRGRMAKNMRPTHATTAALRGSWGVGKDYYRVLTRGGRIFEIYFDRSPKSIEHRKGAWFLFQELKRVSPD